MIRVRFTEDQLQLNIEALCAVIEDCPDADWNRDVRALADKLNGALIHYQDTHPCAEVSA